MEKTAKPIQARSQKTRENILKAALSMYTKKGYYKTTVDDIAEEAGVSTGIAYRYFRNKKDLLLSVISYGADNIESIVSIDKISELNEITDLRQYLEIALKNFEIFHIRYRGIHEELEGLKHTDEDVRKLYCEISNVKIEDLSRKLSALIKDAAYIREKTYSAVNIMEQHCHMLMNNDLYNLDSDAVRSLTINAVLLSLNKKINL